MSNVAEQFKGLSKKQAQQLAEIKNLIFRLIIVDGEQFFSMPEDQRDDRVCVEIENGQVVKASIQ
jgi:hypothetical protein